MIIYIIHRDCYYTFDLNLGNNGKYILSDFDQNLNQRSLVNVEIKDGKAFINSNANVKLFYDNTEHTGLELLVGSFYRLDLVSGESVVLFVSLAYDNTFVHQKVLDNSVLKIGKDSSNDIVYYFVCFC